MKHAQEAPRPPPYRPAFGRARLIALALVVAVLGLGLWSYRGLRASVYEMRANDLQASLDAQINALDVWIGNIQQDARRAAAKPEVRRRVEVLVAAERKPQTDDAARRALIDLLADSGEGAVAVHLMDRHGVILMSRFRHYVGRRASPDVLARLAPVFADRPVFIRPYHESERLIQLDEQFPHPLVWMEVPVHDARGKAIAALGFGYRADAQFARLFQAAWPGQTGEIYAFDTHARVLSEIRRPEDARRLGLLSAEAQRSSVLSLQLREPPSADAAAQPLTALARAALAHTAGGETQIHRGALLEPYRSYLGTEVIGAWRWLPEYDMGVAVEIEAAEAYAPLRYLNIGVAGTGLLMLLIAAALFVPQATLLRWFPAGTRRVGPYRLLAQIGEGAISDVYLARHRYLKRPAAVKILKSSASSDEWRARFEREVQLAARLNHPNTIAIYDYGLGEGGTFYYAMEYVDGLSFAELVERYGPVPPARTAHLLRQVCSSLAQAHAQGIIHRDIKPQNIMVSRGAGDVVKVLDFGLVKQLDADDTRDLTRALRILGTPLYMSPERIREPGCADARADIYSLGAVGFFLLTGRRLFETENDHDLTYHILHVPAPRASVFAQHSVPAALDDLLRRCLSKDARERPASAQEAITVLDRTLAEEAWTREQSEAWWQAVSSGTITHTNRAMT